MRDEIASDEEQLKALIARKAYELYEERGREPGHEVTDWLEAERTIKNEMAESKTSRFSMKRFRSG